MKWRVIVCGFVLAGCGADASVDPPTPPDAQIEASADVAEGSVDAWVDQAVEASVDATPDVFDAGVDAPADAPPYVADAALVDADAAQDAEAGPPVCSDGVVDPGEECDDGNSALANDSCSSFCEVRDLLADRAASDGGKKSRALGTGRHPLGGSALGFAAAWIDTAQGTLGATFYDAKGVPSGKSYAFAAGSPLSAAPVVAALPGGVYALASADLGGDGDGLGVALRRLDPNVVPSGSPAHANVTTALAQYAPDALWTGTELVVAWVDGSNLATGPDVRYRTFDAQLVPTSGELTLAGSSAVEADVALAPFAGGFMAAWRESQNGQEVVRAKVGGVAFAVGPFAPGPYADPPALAELDSTHALLVYAEGAGSVAKLRGAVLDLSQPGTATAFDLPPLTQGSTPPGIFRPNALRVGARVFVAWTSEAVLADPRAEETWLKEVTWSGSALGLGASEVPLPRWDAHRLGDQRSPALGAVGTSLLAGWLDLGATFVGSANMDVAVELIPTPMVRHVGSDGGGL